MLFVCLTHLMSIMDNSLLLKLSQFGHIAVLVFFIISGYLHKDKRFSKKNLIKKIIILDIPIFLIIGFHIILCILTKNYDIFYKYLIYLFNVAYFFKNGIIGLNHLWFITIIIICYILTLCIKNKKIKTNHLKNINCILLFLAIVVSFFSELFGVLFFYLFCYLLGYLYNNKKIDKKKSIFYFGIIIICLLIHFLGHVFLDNTVLYNIEIVYLTNIVVSFLIFKIIMSLTNFSSHSFKIIDFFDEISYPIFVSHYMFMVGKFSLINITNIKLLNVIIIIMSSFISAIIINLVSKKVSTILKSKFN